MRYANITALTLLTSVFAASGCGGGSSGSTSASAPPPRTASIAASTQATTPPAAGQMSRAALIARADPICAHVNKVLAATSLRSKVDYEKQLPGVISSEQAAAEKLAKLRPPAELASDWSQIVDALRTIATVTTKIDQAAIAGQHENAIHSLLISGQNARLQAMRTARSDGFHDCAQLG